MTNRRRFALPSLIAGALGLLAPGAAAQVTDTATVTSVVSGSMLGAGREITSVSPVTLTSVGGLQMSGNLAVVITQTATTGSPGWHVTLESTDLAISGGSSINKGVLGVEGRLTTPVGLAGGISVTDEPGLDSLSTAVTLFTVNGELAANIYSGLFTHAAAVVMDVPNGAESGTYLGTLTVTIVE